MKLSITLKEIKQLLLDNKLLTASSIKSLETTINNLSYDSRNIEPNTLFFCKGFNYKKEYLVQAINNGSICYISEEKHITDCDYFIVNDVRKSMAIIAAYFYKYSFKDIETIALTGTKGKTTTTYFIKNIIDCYMKEEQAYITTVETYTKKRREESHLTTPEALDLHKIFFEIKESKLNYLTMEVTSQAYKMDRVIGIKFNHGIFLNITEDHIGSTEHKNFEDYFSCKLKLIENVEDMIINYNMANFNRVKTTCENNNVPYTTFGYTKGADYYFENVRSKDGIVSFNVINKKDNYSNRFSIKMMGLFNVENALASIILAKKLNIQIK